MRGISGNAAGLAAIVLGLVLVFCNSARPEGAAQAKTSIKDLQQKRLEILEQMCEVGKKEFQNARLQYGELHALLRELFTARLEYAQTREERIKVCDDAIEEARKYENMLEALLQSARGTQSQVLRARAYVLETQIARAKAEAGK